MLNVNLTVDVLIYIFHMLQCRLFHDPVPEVIKTKQVQRSYLFTRYVLLILQLGFQFKIIFNVIHYRWYTANVFNASNDKLSIMEHMHMVRGPYCHLRGWEEFNLVSNTFRRA